MKVGTLCEPQVTFTALSGPWSDATSCARRTSCPELSKRQLVLSVTKAQKSCKGLASLGIAGNKQIQTRF